MNFKKGQVEKQIIKSTPNKFSMKYTFLFLIFLNVLTVQLQAQPTQPHFQIPKLKTPPKIDGRLSSKEWSGAVLLTDYVVWTLDEYVSDRVETYLQFDHENLYVGFKGYFSDKELFKNSLEEYKPIDSHLWGRNHFGVQLISGNASIDIKAGPSLSKMDFKNGDLAWNGKWDFAASVNEADWTGEFKIPFADLDIKSSPTGETWSLILTRSNPSGVDAEWRGHVKFVENIPVIGQVGKWPNPLPGINNLPISFENKGENKQEVNCEILLFPFRGYPDFLNQQGQGNSNAEMILGLREKPILYKKKISIPAKNSIKENLEYKISSEGNYYAVAYCISSSGDTLQQSVGYWFTVTPNKERLIQLSKKLGEAKGILKGSNEITKSLLEKHNGLALQLLQLKNTQNVFWDKKKWNEFTDKTDTLEIRTLQFSQQVKFAALNNFKSNRSYGVIASHAIQKIKRDREFTDQFFNKFSIAAARNEYESFQLIFLPFHQDISNISINVNDLVSQEGIKISKENVEVSLIDYNYIGWQSSYLAEKKGWHPDPLLPITKAFSLKGTEICRPVWVTVHVPKTAKPGKYITSIDIVANNSEKNSIAIELNVRDFELPDESHLKTHTWNEIEIMQKFYNVKEFPVSWYLNFCDVLLKNRLNPSFAGVNYVTNKALPDGKYDFSNVEKILAHTIPKGLSRFSMVQMKKGDYPPGELEAEFRFIKEYADFLRSKGWLDKGLVELWDEPTILEWEAVKLRAESIRKISPDIKTQLFCSGGDPYKFWDTAVSKKYGLLDLIDLWMPLSAIEAPEIQKSGHEVWTYFCTLARGSAPNFYIDAPAINQRVIAWYCWLYGVDGFEHWSSTYFWRNAKEGKPMDQKWPNVLWDSRTFHDFHGEGQLVYPGPNGQFYPSVRLETFRDGMDDYEYLFKLRELLSNPKKSKEEGIYLDAQKLLNVGESLLIKYPEDVQSTLENTIRYPNEPERILELREKIAEAIERLQKQ